MEMDPATSVGTAQCGGGALVGRNWLKRTQRQRLRRGGAQVVGRRLKTQDRTSRLEQDLDPGRGVMI
jgi:hypothetical protein